MEDGIGESTPITLVLAMSMEKVMVTTTTCGNYNRDRGK